MKTALSFITIFCFTALQLHAQKKVKVKLNDDFAALNASLPKDFTNRTFIKGLAMYRNKIEDLAGTLILLENQDKASILGQYLKPDQPVLKNSVLSDVLYDSKISAQFSYNGSYMIASASASTNSILELIITDVNGVLVPEQSIPYLDICRASAKVSSVIKKNLYYVRSVKVTSVYSRAYKEIENGAGISGNVFSVSGKVYSSSDQFKVDYVVAADLISINNLLMTRNCTELISNSDLAARKAADKARQDAERAEEERKAREAELNAARAETILLRNRMDELEKELRKQTSATVTMQNQMDSLKLNMKDAQQKMTVAGQQLQQADSQLKAFSAIAATQQKKVDSTDGKAPPKANVAEIKEVKKLTDEEVKELGFEKPAGSK